MNLFCTDKCRQMKGIKKGVAGLLDGGGSKLHKSDREERKKGFTIEISVVNPLVVF